VANRPARKLYQHWSRKRDSASCREPPESSTLDNLSTLANESKKRVLIYRLGSLGDTVVALPALHLVERAYPNAERRMLTNIPVNSKAPAAEAILRGTGLVNGYFHYKVGTRSLFELASLWWELARWRPQVVVYLAAFRSEAAVVRDSRFFSLCGIRTQVGVPLTSAMQENLPGDGGLEPEASRLARNLAELGDGLVDDPASWDLRITQAEHVKAQEALSAVGEMPVIAISVGTKVQSKDWGAENWRSLLRELAAAAKGHALVLCGAAEEFAASEAAAAGWQEAGGSVPINLCGKLTPRESAAVFERARMFLGHDSGPMHLAAAVQTPCVAIFAARNKPRVWFPYGRQHKVIYHQVDCWGCGLETCVVERKKCITSITVHEVMAAVTEVLGRG
jgi:ADP-heptose:LPS heptosyltransferase